MYRQIVVRDTTRPIVTLNACDNGEIDIVLLFGEEYTECGATATDNYDGPLEVLINNPIIIICNFNMPKAHWISNH